MSAAITPFAIFEKFSKSVRKSEQLVGLKVSVDLEKIRFEALISDVHITRNVHNNKMHLTVRFSLVEEKTEHILREIISRRPSSVEYEPSDSELDEYYRELTSAEYEAEELGLFRDNHALELSIWEDGAVEIINPTEDTVFGEYNMEAQKKLSIVFL